MMIGKITFSALVLAIFCLQVFSQSAMPKTAEEFNISGIVALNAGKEDEAIRKFTRAIELNPNFADAYANRCRAYVLIDNPDAALADCDQAIKLNPKLWTSYYNRGLIFHGRMNFEKAFQDYSTVISLKDDISMAYYYRAMLYSGIPQDYEKAILDL